MGRSHTSHVPIDIALAFLWSPIDTTSSPLLRCYFGREIIILRVSSNSVCIRLSPTTRKHMIIIYISFVLVCVK
jgi:hypothetical protein